MPPSSPFLIHFLKEEMDKYESLVFMIFKIIYLFERQNMRGAEREKEFIFLNICLQEGVCSMRLYVLCYCLNCIPVECHLRHKRTIVLVSSSVFRLRSENCLSHSVIPRWLDWLRVLVSFPLPLSLPEWLGRPSSPAHVFFCTGPVTPKCSPWKI